MIQRIDGPHGPVSEAFPPMSVTVLLADDLDVSRGDMLCRPHNQPAAAQNIEAMVCWMTDARPLTEGSRLVVKHTTRTVRARVAAIRYRIEINGVERESAVAQLALNDIGRIVIKTADPLAFDLYQDNKANGGAILIDSRTNVTVGALMFRANAE